LLLLFITTIELPFTGCCCFADFPPPRVAFGREDVIIEGVVVSGINAGRSGATAGAAADGGVWKKA
jgi:hypothetical protein